MQLYNHNEQYGYLDNFNSVNISNHNNRKHYKSHDTMREFNPILLLNVINSEMAMANHHMLNLHAVSH